MRLPANCGTCGVCTCLWLQGRELAREFQEVECEVRTVEAEHVGVDLLTAELTEKLPGDLEGLASSFGKLQQSLEAAKAYVDEVLAGRQKGSVAIGRWVVGQVGRQEGCVAGGREAAGQRGRRQVWGIARRWLEGWLGSVACASNGADSGRSQSGRCPR